MLILLISRYMYLRVSQKKICDSGQMMGEVIIKWIYFYYIRFRQLFERAMLKNQNQKMHCAHAQIFSTERSQLGMPLKIMRKKNSRIFGNFITQHFLWIYITFHILTQPKKFAKFFFTIFSGIIHWLRPWKKSAHAHNVFFDFGFWALLARIV